MKVAPFAFVLVCAACGSHEEHVPVSSTAPSLDRGQVVADVGGTAIYAADLRERAARDHVDARTALGRLIDEELIAAAALGRGPNREVDLDAARKRRAVEALIEREVEGRVRRDSVNDAEASAFYDRNRTRFVHPERRVSLHVLAEVPPSAGGPLVDVATAFIEQTLTQIRQEGVQAVFSRVSSLHAVPGTEIRLRVEQVPALDRHAAADEAYLAALFSVDEPGPLASPVRSSFGIHGIVVSNIEPAVDRDFEDAKTEIVDELLVEKRTRHFEQWMASLKSSQSIDYNETAIRELVSSSALP